MRIMYWNCTAPAGRDDKKPFAIDKCEFIGARVRACNPAVLCLDEVSSSVSHQSEAQAWADKFIANGDRNHHYECKGIIQNEGTHLNAVVFIHHEFAKLVTVSGEGLPSKDWITDKTKRNLLRAEYQDKKGTGRIAHFWFLHANASRIGGKTAVGHAAKWVADRNNDVLIGDFNNDITHLKSDVATTPSVGNAFEAWSKELFTQWKTSISPSLGLRIFGSTYYLIPNATYDFAVSNKHQTVKLTAADSLAELPDTHPNVNGLGFLLLSFDHFPIVYDITFP